MSTPTSSTAGHSKPTVLQLRVSAAVRCLLATSLAAGIATLAVITSWGPLRISTDIVGYPIFAAFNVNNYFTAYYWIFIGFPVLTLVFFLGFTWGARRLRLPVPPPRALRVGPLPGPRRAIVPEPDDTSATMIGGSARALIVGLTLGLETAMAAGDFWVGLLLGSLVYLVLLAAATVAWSSRDRTARRLTERVSRLNTLGAPLAILGLWPVSTATQLSLVDTHVAIRYPWFSPWVAVALTAIVLGTTARKARTADASRIIETERRLVVWLSGAVLVFLLVITLPGDLAAIDFFEEGQGLTGGTLVSHGFLPYRDVILAHGPFFDAVRQIISWQVFGHTRWAVAAGDSVLFVPFWYVGLYWLCAYLVGRDWPILVLVAISATATSLVPGFTRFLLWPLVLIALGQLLKRRTPGRVVAFTVLLFAQVLASPEALEAVPGCLAVIVAFDLYHRDGEARLRTAFGRTLSTVGAGALLSCGLLGFLVSQHAVGGVLSYFRALSEGHQLTGGVPFEHYPQLPHATFAFEALTPVVGLIVWCFYFASRLLRRDVIPIADWVVTAAAAFALLYYQKFLARADGHVLESYSVAIPVLVYVLHSLLRDIRRRLPRRPQGWLSPPAANPLSILVAATVLGLTWSRVDLQASNSPTRLRAIAATRATLPAVGYGPFAKATLVRDLKRVLNLYLGSRGTVADFTNEPGLLFYLLGLKPATRYYIIGEVFGADTQREVIAELRRKQPALIIYDQNCCGLPMWDQIPNMVRDYDVSQYILDHYRPLLRVDGQTLFANVHAKGPAPSRVAHLLGDLPEQSISTSNLYEPSFPCDWGYAPNYFSARPTSKDQAHSVALRSTRSDSFVISGWSTELADRRPALKVVAVQRGRIIGETHPTIARPDVAAKFGSPRLARSGWQMTLPISAAADEGTRGGVQVFALVGHDRAIPLVWQVPGVALPNSPVSTAPIPAVLARQAAAPGQALGYVDQAIKQIAYPLTPPAGRPWSRYRWLELDAWQKPGAVDFNLFDQKGAHGNNHRWIAFRTIDHGPKRFLVHVGSCPQWRAYGSAPLILTESAKQAYRSIRLIP